MFGAVDNGERPTATIVDLATTVLPSGEAAPARSPARSAVRVKASKASALPAAHLAMAARAHELAPQWIGLAGKVAQLVELEVQRVVVPSLPVEKENQGRVPLVATDVQTDV